MRPMLPGKPGRFLIRHPDEPMSIEDRAFEMWAVHPLDLDSFGIERREDFYAAHLRAAIRQGTTE